MTLKIPPDPVPMANTKELRRFLVEQMQGVAAGKVNSEKAKAIANLAQQIYNTLSLEVRMAISKQKLGDKNIDPITFID